MTKTESVLSPRKLCLNFKLKYPPLCKRNTGYVLECSRYTISIQCIVMLIIVLNIKEK